MYQSCRYWGMDRYLPYVTLVLTEISPRSSGEAREEEVYVGSHVLLPPLHPWHDTSNAWREQNRLLSSSLSLTGLQGLHKPDRTGSSTQLSASLSLSASFFLTLHLSWSKPRSNLTCLLS